MFSKQTTVLASVSAILVCCVLVGCGEPEVTVDSTPFEEAIATYLDRGNMAMAVKEIKKGPTVEGDTATLTASLTHAELGGPAVTWDFRFEKDPDGSWKVTSHED
jgi:hypothetical protein